MDALAEAFAAAGADLISFHPDASTHVDRTVQLIKAAGCQAGLVFNPATPLDVLEWVIDKVDVVLLMSVNPGFGGQSFIDSALRKVEAARKRITASGKDIHGKETWVFGAICVAALVMGVPGRSWPLCSAKVSRRSRSASGLSRAWPSSQGCRRSRP